VGTDVVRAKPGERTMDWWAKSKLIDFAAGKEGKKHTKELFQKEMEEDLHWSKGPIRKNIVGNTCHCK